MSAANDATPYQPDGEQQPRPTYQYGPLPTRPTYPARQLRHDYQAREEAHPYPPMTRPASPRTSGAALGHPDLPTRPPYVLPWPEDGSAPPRAPKLAAAQRMPKAQALAKVRGLKKGILGLTLGSFVAFATLAATHTRTTSSTASATSSSSTSSSNSSSSTTSSSGFGFGSSSSSSQAPVSGSSSS